MKLFLMRHGETPYNEQHRLQGQRDIALNDRGRHQAEAAAKWCQERGLHFQAVFSSPLIRAKQTAALTAGVPEENVSVDERLLEIDFGPLEGKKWELLTAEERQYVDNPWESEDIEGVEDPDHVIERVTGAVKDISGRVVRELGDDASVLIVTHGMALHGILTGLTDNRESWKEPLGNCCIFLSETDGETLSPPVRLTPLIPTFR